MDNALAPGLLLAAPALGDPNFEKSVVLLGHHDEDGAVGWVVNGEALGPAIDLLRQAGLVEGEPRGRALRDQARRGGPVMPGSAWLLYERGAGDPEWGGRIEIGDRFAITGAREAIEAVARGGGPSRFRLLLGYAGWAAGQLEGEIREGAWLPAPVVDELLLDGDSDGLWDAAYQRATGTAPGAFGGKGGSA